MTAAWLSLAACFFTGLLAGEEVAICLAIRRPLARLDQRAHIRLRQDLIRTLRLLVPAIALPALLATGGGVMAGLPQPGLLPLLGFAGVTLAGTVPINQAALEWDPEAPPADWQRSIGRWEQLDKLRMALALAAFALTLVAAVRA